MILRPTNPRVIAPGAGSSIDRSIDTIALSISAISREVGDKYTSRRTRCKCVRDSCDL